MPTDSEPPFTASDLAGNSGELPTLTWRGTTYKVAFPCPKSVHELENFAKRESYKRLGELNQEIKEAADEPWVGSILEVKNALMGQLTGRKYAIGESLYNAVFSNASLRCGELWACLKVAGNELSFDDLNAMVKDVPDEVSLVMGELNRGFFALTQLRIPGLRMPEAKKKESPKTAESPIGIEGTPGS